MVVSCMPVGSRISNVLISFSKFWICFGQVRCLNDCVEHSMIFFFISKDFKFLVTKWAMKVVLGCAGESKRSKHDAMHTVRFKTHVVKNSSQPSGWIVPDSFEGWGRKSNKWEEIETFGTKSNSHEKCECKHLTPLWPKVREQYLPWCNGQYMYWKWYLNLWHSVLAL